MKVKRVQGPREKRCGKYHHGDLAEQLALAAVRVVETEGHEALRLRKLAKELRVSEPAVYRHYASRDALLAEVLVRGTLGLIEALRDAIEPIDDPFETMRIYGRTYLCYAVAHRGWFRLQFDRYATEALVTRPEAVERLQSAPVLLEQLFARLRGALPPGDEDVADLYRLIWTQAHGVAGLVVERAWQLVRTDEERVEAGIRTIDRLVDALEARHRAG